MNRCSKTVVFLNIIIFLCIPLYAQAQEPSKNKPPSPEDVFTRGRLSLQLVSGVINSMTKLPEGSPVLGYAQTNVRVGWMTQSPSQEKSFWRGNWEVIGEVSNSFIYKGPGTYIGGVTALLRYNFVQPGWRFIPFVQGGVGIVYNDIYEDETQKAVGQAIEFTPQCSLGLRYLINKNWSVDGEAIFHHISNAGMANRNRSLNSLGGFVGVTYYLDSFWKPSEDSP